MKLKSILAALCVTALCLPALAQTTSTPRIDQRQANQQKRIDQGVQSGALTQQEAARLQHGQEHVQNLENKATADGKVTAKERARIEHAQDVQSQRVYRQKHDRQHDLNHDGRMDRPARRK
jgi:uncharacterized membrane protein YebE (DUF533 family)